MSFKTDCFLFLSLSLPIREVEMIATLQVGPQTR